MNEYLKITNECNLDLMARYEDNYFDLAIVDPPYGINMAMGHKGSEKRGDKNKYKNFAGNDSLIPPKQYWDELFRVSKNQIVWGGNYMIEFLKPTPCFIVWDKVQPENFSMAMAEFAWTSFDSPAKIFKKRIVGADTERIHPTQKPTSLYQWLLTKYAEKGNKILDTHLGSGSIAIAVDSVNKIEKLDLELVACELDKNYYEQAKARIERQTNWNSLF